MSKSQILTDDGKHIRILTDVKIDRSLPKYKKIEEKKPSDRHVMTLADGTNPHLLAEMRSSMTYENLKRVASEKNPDIEDFNVTVTDNVNEIIRQTSMDGFTFNTDSGQNTFTIGRLGQKEERKINLFRTVVDYLKTKRKTAQDEKADDDSEKKFDVLAFFSDVHGLLDSKETGTYVNRVSDIIECIGLSEVSGQIAYKEKLMRTLVVNKLESILYSKGMYKALNEDAIVKLCQNSPKALKLDYIANFTRTIPIDVIRKKVSVDKMQIFDNYAILHFDPEGTGTGKTDKEKKKEIDAKRDPILFGLIAGSDKLYFISDWIDDKCDLTLEKVIELTSKEVVESGFLKENAEIEQS